MKSTKPTDDKQPFGRIPEDFRGKLAKLSHLECHVFTMLTITSVRSVRDPRLGCVDISKSALAREMGIDPKSLRRATKKLFEAGLLDEPNDNGASCPKSWGIMPSYIGPYALPPRASCPPESPQPQPSIDSYEPLKGSEEVSEKEVKRKKASTTSNSKKSKSKSASKKKPSATAELLKWDAKAIDFVGDRPKLREKLYGKYDDLGADWINATYNSITEWCDDRPEHMEGVKDCYLFILGWYRRDAKAKRERAWT